MIDFSDQPGYTKNEHIPSDESLANGDMHGINAGQKALSTPYDQEQGLPLKNTLTTSHDVHEAFFKEMLGDIDESTFPYGITKADHNDVEIAESSSILPQDLNNRLRLQAKEMGVSMASLCHVAWAQVLARITGQERIIFGTVLLDRLHTEQTNEHGAEHSIQILPLRCDIDSQSVQECVRQTNIRLGALLEHGNASLTLTQKCSGVPADTPLFSSVLNYLDASLPLSGNSKSRRHTDYPFTLTIEDLDTVLGLMVQTVEPADPVRVNSYMKQALESLVVALESTPNREVLEIEVLPPEERKLLLQGLNTFTADYPRHKTIHQLFEDQVQQTPQATALVFMDQSLTYLQLNEHANRLAYRLIELGVQPDTLVAICVDRSIAMITGILGILKAGGAYVPLDPAYASGRLRDILADATPAVVLVDESGRNALGEELLSSTTILDPNTLLDIGDSKSHVTPNPQVSGLNSRHLAYGIFTSGSGGKPKGVMIEHSCVVNLVMSRPEAYGAYHTGSVALFPSFGFDSSVVDIFATLTFGGTLHLLPEHVRLDRLKLWEYLKKYSITQTLLPPAILQGSTDIPQLDMPLTIVTAGEALPPTLIRTLQSQIPNVRIVNDYGPTEATVSAISWKCPQDFDGDIVPIGRPIANKRIYILDKHRQPVPLGAIGELYIGGVGIARGYLNKPDLTAETFLPDPFSEDKDGRMYKTGDLVQYLPDGNVIFLGRNDHQVKIRGFRIELGEIETRLVDHALVDKAVVIAIGEGTDKKLIGYVESEPNDQLVSTLRSHLSSCLPDYMVPAAIVRMDSFPLTRHGKIDRAALPLPSGDTFTRQDYEEPQGETEAAVARIWCELLGLDRVSRNDNFFALGGHSLLAVQLIERLRRLGLTLTVRTLFKSPTLSSLTQSLEIHHDHVVAPNLILPSATAITPDMLPLIDLNQSEIDHIIKVVPGGVSNIQDIYPLAPLQEGILFHHLLATKGDPFLLISFMIFDTRELFDRYLDAIQRVVDRHDILRTSFVWENLSTSVQVVWRKAPLSVTELQLDPVDGAIKDQLMQRLDPRKHRIDLSQAPLLRFTVAQDVDGRWLLVQLTHHLISDHSTLEAIKVEVKAFMDDQDHTLPLPQPFRNLIAQAISNHSHENHENFFKEMLADIDTPSLPFDLKDVHGDGDEITTSYRTIPQELNHRLRRQAKQLGVSVASLCHLAWAMVISRSSGEDCVVFGTVLFGRMKSGPGSDSAFGLFINTLPLRVDLTGSVRESVIQTHERLASLLEHEHASLALAQQCSSVPQGTPLFSSMLNYRHNAPSVNETPLGVGIEFLGGSDRTNYPLTIAIDDVGTELSLTVDVVCPLDPSRICGYMEQVLQSLCDALEGAPEIEVHGMEILPRDEREMMLQRWNSTKQDYPTHLCIHQVFENQVQQTPQATALVFMDQSLTYLQLNEHANRLAYRLIELGVQPDALVAICVDRSIAMITGILGILKAGGAYVPLDPAYASGRLRDILADATPAVVLVDESGRNALGEELLSSTTILDPNTLLNIGDSKSCVTPNPQVSGLNSRHLAYGIFTSGSGGKPKGVMIEHSGVVNLVMSRPEAYGAYHTGSVALFPSFGFDSSVVDIFTTLAFGGTLHLLPEHVRLDRLKLWEYLKKHSITLTLLPPAILQGSTDIPQLDMPLTIVTAGEALPPTLVRTLQSQIPNVRIVNDYGPTEATVSAISWKCPQDFDGDIVPIGRPIANKRIYILDKHRQPVPLGAIGELYIGGVGIARGYLNKPDLTAETFLPDPFSEDKDGRMYKTGDLVQYLPDGNVIFLGRNDHQVKIRGFRIELGEIETRLVDHALVDKAVVIAIGEGTDKKLIGYVESEPNDQLVSTLRSHLSSCLPDYMVPAAIVRMDSFPLTRHGKIDRAALPLPSGDTFTRQDYEEPQGETEAAVARIWCELLGLDRVSRNDNFFALGGHSLLAVQLIERLRRLGLTLTVRTLFKSPTLSSLTQSLEIHHDHVVAPNLILPSATAITPDMLPLIDLNQSEIDHIIKVVPGGVSNIQDIYPLAPLQEGILFHHLLATKGDPYLLISLMAFDTRELFDRYLDAIQRVVDRHDILRTSFVWENLSTSVQVVWRKAPLSVTELQLDPVDGAIKDQLMQRLDPRKHRIDLSQAPLLRFTVAQDVDGRWLLVQLLHHLIGDHSTLDVMYVETKAFMDNQGHSLPTPQPFRNLFAQAKSSHSQDDHESFFKEMLADIDTPSLPFDLKNVHGDGGEASAFYQPVPQDLNDQLRRQAKQLGVSVASLCHLAWAMVVSHTSGDDRVVFGTVLFGRMKSGPGSDSAMGLFINTLPLRVDVKGDVHSCVLQTHERLAALLEHELASLALAQRCSNVSQETPLFSAMLNYRHNVESSDETSFYPGIVQLDSDERDSYPLSLSVEDYGSSLGLTVGAVQPVNPDRICGYMQQALQSLADALEYSPDTNVQTLEVIPTEERHLLLETWNATKEDYPKHLCIHSIFEQHVESTPDATAVVSEDQSLTYSQLNKSSNQLAHHLIGLGVGPDMRVAICMERSPAMIIGILGILKAGGAYVPLDPTYASERLRDIFADSEPSTVVVDETGRSVLGEMLSSVRVVDLSSISRPDGWKSIAPGNPSNNPKVSGLNPHHLAYIIYTSGSTGKPKGVMIEHHGVVNYIRAQSRVCGARPLSRVIQLASFGFDASVWEIFLPLTSGAALYQPPPIVRHDRDELWEYMIKHSITIAAPTPSFLQDGKDLSEHKMPLTLCMGGEALSRTLLQNLLSREFTVVNDYGPTEITIGSITWISPPDFCSDIVPIGRPLPNTRIYILDRHQQPVPLGVTGEMYIGGVGVARGYLNRPELTSEKFLKDPFTSDTEARMYRTGDLARYLPDGNIVFLGRNDAQIKIRGFRIEPGEIEARLSDHPLVQKAVVIAIGQGVEKRLVAYVVTKPDDDFIRILHSYLASCLPDYMVPAAFVRLDKLPLTSNGKIDLRQLPEPDDSSLARQLYEPPQGEIEQALATIWSDLLNVDKVGRNDNFFMLGGHSLLSVKMINQVKTLMGFNINLGALFEAPTISELVPRLLTAGNIQEDTFDVLLPIKPRGKRPPLFCVHDGFGFAWSFIGLTKHMDADQPLYGLQARGFFDNSQPAATLEGMALDYIDQIRRIQPHGPYCLLGYSFGGMVAHTMAAHLERQGEEVALLAAMDSVPKLGGQDIRAQKQDENEEETSFVQLFANRVQDAIPEMARSIATKAPQVIRSLGRLGVEHSPPKSNSGLILFRAMVQKDSTGYLISPDEWRPYVEGNIEVYDIDCEHYEMDRPIPLAQIGGVLAHRLHDIHRR